MKMKSIGYIIANFGGPRDLSEVRPFLESLLTDQDVVRTKFPPIIHNYLFKRVAKKRALKIADDYKAIGGGSPIFADTEAVAALLRKRLKGPILTFHRYLPATHDTFIERAQMMTCDAIRVFPMFPQFTYATTGSIARWFEKKLPKDIVNKIRWVKSYPAHPGFISAQQKSIRQFLDQHGLKDEETILLFSAHGVPENFVATGDLYQDECEASFKSVMKAFPNVSGRLSYQSKFGPEEWLKPYTIDACKEIRKWNNGRSNVVFVPISFTSDHIETLFEIETEYMTVIRQEKLNAYRLPALTLNKEWIQAIGDILEEVELCNNQMLVRRH